MLNPTHKLIYDRGIFFCIGCGGFAVEKPRKLARACAGYRKAAGSAVLRRLSKGLPPYGYEWPIADQSAIPQGVEAVDAELRRALLERLREEEEGELSD